MTYSYKKFNEDLIVDQILFDECRDNGIKQRKIDDEVIDIDSIALHALTDFIANEFDETKLDAFDNIDINNNDEFNTAIFSMFTYDHEWLFINSFGETYKYYLLDMWTKSANFTKLLEAEDSKYKEDEFYIKYIVKIEKQFLNLCKLFFKPHFNIIVNRC